MNTKNLLMLLLICMTWTVSAQIILPLASPKSSIMCTVGLTEVKLDYYRPKMKERNIFGEGSSYLVPYGKIWRTGANKGTLISFSDDVKIQGQSIQKGMYLIFTWPGPSEWGISLYSDTSLGGNTDKYDRNNEVIRFKVPIERLTEKVDTFTITISDIDTDNENANIQIAWDHTSVKFGINVDYDKRVMGSIERVMESIEENANMIEEYPDSYIAAAKYYYERKKDLKQALEWINTYLNLNEKNAKKFWYIYLKAQIQKDLHDKKGSLSTAKKSLELARKAPNDFGYVKRNEELIKSFN